MTRDADIIAGGTALSFSVSYSLLSSSYFCQTVKFGKTCSQHLIISCFTFMDNVVPCIHDWSTTLLVLSLFSSSDAAACSLLLLPDRICSLCDIFKSALQKQHLYGYHLYRCIFWDNQYKDCLCYIFSTKVWPGDAFCGPMDPSQRHAY